MCTVGRLLDHLKKDDALRTRLADLRMLILDEGTSPALDPHRKQP